MIFLTALSFWFWQCVLAECGPSALPERFAGCPGALLFHADQLTLGPVKFARKITPESVRAEIERRAEAGELVTAAKPPGRLRTAVLMRL